MAQQVETELQKWGGLFRNTSKAGNVYYSGTLEIDGKKRTVVMYRNDYWKEGEQKPTSLKCKPNSAVKSCE